SMLKLGTFALLLAGISTSAAAVTVETATGDWSKLPQLSQRGYNNLNEKMQAKLYEIAQSKECPSFGLKQDRLDFSITFAVQYAPDGSLSRLIFPTLACAHAESVIGGTLVEMLQAGDYAPTVKSAAGWYKGGLGFSFAGTGKFVRDPAVVRPTQPQIAKSGVDPTEIVCEKVEQIGTRLVANRTCMTRAEWAEQKRLNREEVNRVQTQRGCGPMGLSC
ncbi:MAG TPA: hypothetical protein VNR86_09950, partial [Sphingomicrobium sp.]|nr:hypothetical protein [Sphingomicrobium sp.]